MRLPLTHTCRGLLSAILLAAALTAGSLDHAALEQEFERLAAGFDGRVGVCVQDAARATCLHGAERFPMQSVMKLLVAVAVVDAVEQGRMTLNDRVLVRREDLSLFVQPIEKLVGSQGFSTTVGDLVRRAVVESDSAATDILIARLGGPAAVQARLDARGLRGLRLDRDERHLQTEIFGLTWKPEYADKQQLQRAIDAVPETQRARAFEAYRADVRDTSTPGAMAAMLYQLGAGQLFSAASTQWLSAVLRQTVTFPDRLKAGVPPGWTLGHKTGTSNTWRGLTAATNDVGILTTPDGATLAIAVFIADSRAPEAARAALMARLAAGTAAHYRQQR